MRAAAKNSGSEDLAENLRLLCSYKRSVSEVCRKLEINRQQFARYLSGETLPSSGNIRKICDYFGVEEYEIRLPAAQFRDLIVVKTDRTPHVSPGGFQDLVRHVQDDSGALGHKYVGYYYRYLRSVEYPEAIIKACVRVFEHEGRTWLKAIERMKPPGDRQGHGYDVYKYSGVLMHLSDRIFIVESDTILKNAITETILYPTHKNPMTFLFGKALGVSSGLSREPYLTPIVYEYLGTQISERVLIANCGLLPETDDSVDRRIRTYLLERG